jgi:hypothetical protein
MIGRTQSEEFKASFSSLEPIFSPAIFAASSLI